jgi:hypothetical protein
MRPRGRILSLVIRLDQRFVSARRLFRFHVDKGISRNERSPRNQIGASVCQPYANAATALTSYQLGKLLSRRRIDSIPVVVADLGLNLWEVRVCLDKCVATDAIVSCLRQNTGVVLGNW